MMLVRWPLILGSLLLAALGLFFVVRPERYNPRKRGLVRIMGATWIVAGLLFCHSFYTQLGSPAA
jgi:hypothetical protein